jgi:16S rRNA (uracil1498-N3)-methyltransferase
MRRFFFDPKTRTGESVFLSEEESRHVSRVLRLPVATEIELLDGTGTLFRGTIVSTGRLVEVRLENIVTKKKIDAKTVKVFQGILKGEKMDTVVQKCTELGVTALIPFSSSRCQGKLDSKQGRKKFERWQRIGLAACKQCLRLQPMQIAVPVHYSDLPNRDTRAEDGGLRLLFWEEEKKIHLQDISNIEKAQFIDLLLGPEGGLSLEEVERARGLGWKTVSLGDRILRAETATLTAVSIVQYLAGNLVGQE